MLKTIKLFMWGYQPHFRLNLRMRAEKVLQTVAPSVEPLVFLVGIRAPGNDAGHPVCVEPEDGDWDPTLFSGCHARAEEIYKSHPDHSMFYGDEPSMRDKPENIRKKSAREAVREITSVYDAGNATVSFCGTPGQVAGYYVVPVLQFETAQLEAYPRLPKVIRFEDWESPVSFLNAIIMCLLADATSALAAREPGRSIHESRTDVPAILRRAADHFCHAITLATTDIFFQDIFDTLNVISSISYEGEGAAGEILFAPPTSEQVDTRVRFNEPVPLSRQRLARKVVEMSGHGLSCVCHGSDGICGLGSANEKAENVFRVVFTGHYKWDLYLGQLLLMKVAFGLPKLPLPRLNAEEFYSTARRIFGSLDSASGQRLWALVETSMEQQHGTILVISERVAEEASRLKGQAIGITPTELTSDLVRRLSGIDGAVLVSPDGVCYAIGVILDGIATGYGDASRGARYNSATRYFTSSISAERPTMCVVISADGYVDMIPNLLPQLSKAEIDLRVNALKTKDSSDLHETINWLEEHRFYLTPAQCEIVNNEISRIYSAPAEVGELRIQHSKFVSHPGMNESYYLPEG
jgi:sensor domain DACNG-containing protein/sensor domain DACNH-containing protein